MTEVRFYHLEASSVAEEAPKLLQKAYSTGLFTLVRAVDEPSVVSLDKALWTFDPTSFLPHGTGADKADPSEQPIFLTTETDNPNAAKLLLMIDGANGVDADQFERCFYMFNGRDESILAKARQDWVAFKNRGFEVSYWQKDAGSGWAKKI